MAHIATYPRDVLAVSAAVPTIAFSGVTDVQQEAWDLVEGLAPAYGDHWWYISLLAFTRQDQARFDEAGLLAESALSCEPSSGHAVHALTHVLYETGQHEAGRVWLDHWVTESGRSASHRAHFSWHAALHELALGDTEAVRRRYYSQLAPPAVSGVRVADRLRVAAVALAARRVRLGRGRSGLGRRSRLPGEGPPPPIGPILDALDETLRAPARDPVRRAARRGGARGRRASRRASRLLHEHCLRREEPVLRTVVAPVCAAFLAGLDQDWTRADRADRRGPPGARQGRRLGGPARDRRGDVALLPGQRRSGRAGGTTARRAHRAPSLPPGPAPSGLADPAGDRRRLSDQAQMEATCLR